MSANLDFLPLELHKIKTLVDLLRYRAIYQPDSVAYIFLEDGETESARLTYQELDLKARALAAQIQDLVTVGERVLLLYPSSLEYIGAFFGCLYAGAIAVPVYPPRQNQSLSRLQAIIADAQAKVVLTTISSLTAIEKHLTKTPDLAALQWLATDKIDDQLYRSWQEPVIAPDTLAFLQYTSGSTGIPKGVMVSHGNLLYNQQMMQIGMGGSQKTIYVSWLPLFHDMGLVGNTLQPLYLGTPCIMMPPVSFLQKPFRWLKTISDYKAIISGGPNFAYDLCVRKTTPEERITLDLSSWTVAFNGAEPIRAQTLERFAAVFADCGFRKEAFYPCYGMAEATLFVSGGVHTEQPVVLEVKASAFKQNQITAANALADSLKVVSCGKTWLNQQIKIVNPENLIECASNQVGEIWIAGAHVAHGYWNQKALTESTFQAYISNTNEGPFLRTGDLGFIQNGELFVTGRCKDLLIIRGQNHYPQDIELTVENSHPTLRSNSGAAFSVEVEGEEQLVVVQEVERQYLRKLDIDAVTNSICKAVSAQHGLQIHDVVLVKTTSIPKTSSGKIQRSECRRRYLAGTLEVIQGKNQFNSLQKEQVEPVALNSSADILVAEEQALTLETWLIHWVAQKINREPQVINPINQFTDYGLDSLQLIELSGELKDWSGLSLSEGTVYTYPTIRSLSQYIAERLKANGSRLPVKPNSQDSVKYPQILNILSGESALGTRAIADIPTENYQFDLLPEYLELQERFSIYQTGEISYPYFPEKAKFATSTTLVNGQELIDYSHYDYLGLAGEPRVIKAAQQAIEIYGTSSQASPVVSGRTPVHKELEKTIAEWLGVEDCLLYASGHAANVSTIGHIVGANDLIVYDRFCHNSAVQGAIMSKATLMPFPHDDWQALDGLLSRHRLSYRRTLILTEGVFSMDGNIPDFPKLIEIKKRHKAWLMVDEAHSLGVIGSTGRGIGEYFKVNSQDVDLWMGTTSKALAGCGGYIAGCKALINYLKHTSPGFIFAAAMSPATAASTLEALRIIKAEPQRVACLQEKAQMFRNLARSKGLDVGASFGSAIIPIIIGDYAQTAQLADLARQRGINVFPIGWPVVPAEQSRLRFMISALHTEAQIKLTVDTISELIEQNWEMSRELRRFIGTFNQDESRENLLVNS